MKKTDPFKFLSLLSNITDLNVELAIAGIGGSRSMYKNLLNKVIGLLPANIEMMDKFLNEDNDLGAFAIKVHEVKGSLRQVGCPRLADLAEALEKAAKADNRQYCDMNYGAFKEELLQFYQQVNSVMRNAEDTAGSSDGAPGNINDYIDVLMRVKEAAAGYDSTLAARNLAPLLKFRFGGNTDILLKKAADELEAYHPLKALVYITELLNEHQLPSQQHGKEHVR